MVEFANSLSWTYVMGGLAREYDAQAVRTEQVGEWLDAADESGMPFDPRLWTEGPISSTFPACMAVKAAAEQAPDAGYGYLRALREGLMCFRRKLDTTEALVEEARRVKLDVERFRIDLGSHAIVEAFGADLETTRENMRHARRGRDPRNFECRYVHRDGHPVPLTWTGIWSEPDGQCSPRSSSAVPTPSTGRARTRTTAMPRSPRGQNRWTAGRRGCSRRSSASAGWPPPR